MDRIEQYDFASARSMWTESKPESGPAAHIIFASARSMWTESLSTAKPNTGYTFASARSMWTESFPASAIYLKINLCLGTFHVD